MAVKMTNKELALKEIKRLGYVIGCWDDSLEKISKAEFKKVINNIDCSSDVDVMIRRKLHVVEINIVDDEVDFNMLTQSEYINRYGSERWDD